MAGPSRGGGRGRGGGGRAGRPGRTGPAGPAGTGGTGGRAGSSRSSASPPSSPTHSSSHSRPSPGRNGAAGGVLKVSIASDYAAGRDAQDRILDEVQRHGFSTDATFAIRIALEEALVNAIKHGNRHDPGKKIHIEARVTGRRAEITIEDEGPGFNRSGIPDPTLEENLHKCSGRGILLIESYMDGVHWSRGGRRLKMVKENG